jgi:hypothetical protein
VTTPSVEGYLTQPYITVPEFKAAPTWLDVQDLVAGGTQAQQDAELFNVLLRASHWADNFCNQRLGAHQVQLEQFRARTDRQGRIIVHPSNVPVRQITGLAYGPDFQNLTTLTDFTQVWIEDARGIIVSAIPFRGSWSGSLEFGMIPNAGCEVYVQIQYVAGYASTVLSATQAAGQSSLVVGDPTGFQAPTALPYGLSVTIPGSTARIWDPGNEEAVTVSAINGSTLTLASALLNTHTVAAGPAGQIGISELPPEIHQAVITMAVALMMREDVSGEDPFAGTPGGPALRRTASGGGSAGLLDSAYELLEPYRRVR